jgi:general secretion pathway protein G
MSSATNSRTAKTLKLLLLAFLSGAILLLANGNVCRRTIPQFRESVLKEDLATMRIAIDAYTADKKRPPESLQVLVDEKYLEAIPVNPVTRKTDWVPHYVTADMARVGSTVGIDDIHAASGKNSIEGTAYSEW